MRLCKHCQKELPSTKRHDALFCNKECMRRHHAPIKGSPTRCSGDTGAVSEMMVCVDLMLKGYEVFRAISGAASCDLVAIRNGVTIRLQVKTGYTVKGKFYPHHPRPENAHKQDAYVTVFIAEKVIQYQGFEP